MLVQALPSRVPSFWGFVKPGIVDIAGSYGMNIAKVSAELLKRCASGTMQLWTIYAVGANEEKATYDGFMLTEIVTDDVGGEKSLNIWLLYAFKPLSDATIKEGIEAVHAFAKANNCQWISFFTHTAQGMRQAEQWWPGWEVRPMMRRRVDESVD